jgi:hypothetical protein
MFVRVVGFGGLAVRVRGTFCEDPKVPGTLVQEDSPYPFVLCLKLVKSI